MSADGASETVWEGDWSAVHAWVISLFPSGGAAALIGVAWPHAVRISSGRHPVRMSVVDQVDVGDFEEEDFAEVVIRRMKGLLGHLEEDRTVCTLNLSAFVLGEGDEVVKNEQIQDLPRQFRRNTEAETAADFEHEPDDEVSDSTLPMSPPQPHRGGAEFEPDEASSFEDELAEAFSASNDSNSDGLFAEDPVEPYVEAHSYERPRRGAKSRGNLLASLVDRMAETHERVQALQERMILGAMRQNALLTERLLEVHQTALEGQSKERIAASRESTALRAENQRLLVERLAAESDARAERAAEKVRSAEERERRIRVRTVKAMELLRVAEKRADKAEREAEKQAKRAEGETNPVTERAAKILDQAMTTFMKDGKKGKDKEEKAEKSPQKTETSKSSAGGDQEETPQGLRGLVGALGQATPEELGDVLTMIPEKMRRDIFRAMSRKNPKAAAAIGNEFAAELEEFLDDAEASEEDLEEGEAEIESSAEEDPDDLSEVDLDSLDADVDGFLDLE